MPVRATVATIAMLTLLVGGCARPGETGDLLSADRIGTLTVNDRWESCDRHRPEDPIGADGAQEALTMPLLDDSFQPVSAVICGNTVKERPSGGSDYVAFESKTDDLSALLPALRLPDVDYDAEACTADLPAVPWLVLLDAQGRWVRPGVPIDDCGKPRMEFRNVFEKLQTTEVSSKVVSEIESDAAARAGCSQTYGDMTWATGMFDNVREVDIESLPTATEVRRCVYFVPEKERGGDKPAGDFRSGGLLDDGAWEAVRKALVASAPAPACTTPASGFALLQLTRGGSVSVEKDGCRRALVEPIDGGATLRVAGPELLDLVFTK
ncbi:hypothetical protein FHR83_008400 [Actinoplanes campanulatus]|uniref:Lipoprotein n=1 Tax=Actinoplanes campanulatus TaxID=113559 RepID=A0A7W5FJN0_9ACTN|nr:hypothetical protein [Actinoplanes campanulatus]MBB3100675.1 hypothetical protein [Actinoplanes campanulatus]GGN45555.1 hypothetical protein GCM10010109_79860 [Actinoplanes campanulatus]GID41135.1 hypothetical protein Aca09nite_76410 [Actinoplanes campanulatus]